MLKWLLGSILAMGMVVPGFTGLERKYIYPFDARVIPPEAVGLGQINDRLVQVRDVKLMVWSHPPKPGKATILYFTGNAGTLANRHEQFSAFLRNGYGLVAVAYRGSSGSGGRPSEGEISRDARAVFDQIPEILPEAEDIVIYGESLGAAVAVKVAVKHKSVSGVVLENPFTSIRDMARVYAPKGVEGLITQAWNVEKRIGQMRAPLLIIRAGEDSLTPPEMSARLLKKAGSRQKSLYTVKGADHNEVWSRGAPKVLWRFLAGLD